MIRYTAARPNIEVAGISIRKAEMTAAERLEAVFKMIEHAANQAMACPTNDEICRRFGWSSGNTPYKTLRKLEQQGRIKTVFRNSCSRIIEIVATGARTTAPQNVTPPEQIARVKRWREKQRAKRAEV